jgi:DNA-binding NtrC family response regulator
MQPNHKPRVLIVDCEVDNLNNTKRFLDKKGFDCLTTSNKTHALNMLKSMRFNVALIDLHFNGENSGLELIKLINKEVNTSFLIMATYETADALKQAINLGNVLWWFNKPFDLKEVLEKIDEFAYLIHPNKVNQFLSVLNKDK